MVVKRAKITNNGEISSAFVLYVCISCGTNVI